MAAIDRGQPVDQKFLFVARTLDAVRAPIAVMSLPSRQELTLRKSLIEMTQALEQKAQLM